MKLFKDKNRGPKIKSEDVVIPEEFLEYEREAEARKKEEQATHQRDATLEEEMASFFSEAKDPSSNNRFETVQTENETDADSKRVESNVKRAKKSKKNKRTAVEKKEERQQRKANKTPIPKTFKAIWVLIVVVVATIVVMIGPIMAIDHVEINDLNYISDDKVEEMSGLPIGKNLFLFDASEAEKNLEAYPYVKDAKITRHLFHYIDIDITERTPAGIMLNNGNYLQFSKDGILLNNTKSLVNQNLPLITGFSMKDIPAPGEKFKDNDRFNDVLVILNASTDDLLKTIQEINIKDRSNILAYTSQGLEIRLGSVKHIESRMAILNDIINQVILGNIIEEPIEAIDIRYEKSPVVVLEGYQDVDAEEYLESIEAKKYSSNNETSGAAQVQQPASSPIENTPAPETNALWDNQNGTSDATMDGTGEVSPVQ